MTFYKQKNLKHLRLHQSAITALSLSLLNRSQLNQHEHDVILIDQRNINLI